MVGGEDREGQLASSSARTISWPRSNRASGAGVFASKRILKRLSAPPRSSSQRRALYGPVRDLRRGTTPETRRPSSLGRGARRETPPAAECRENTTDH